MSFAIFIVQDQGFPIKIPLEFANLIDKDNPNDPLLKQVIPSIKPQIETLDFSIYASF
jgi:L-lysine 2,3-aminomutase